MKEIKQIIADNLINLRKEHNLTQNELAEKLSYSDNMVSRWERAEIAPNIETLQSISEFYNVPLESLIKEGSQNWKSKPLQTKNEIIRKLCISILWAISVWFISAVIFVYADTVFHKILWQIFVFDVPISCLVILPVKMGRHDNIYKFVVLSVFIWSFLACLYLYFLKYNMFLIFIVGIPAELALVIWAFIKPKNKDNKTENKKNA